MRFRNWIVFSAVLLTGTSLALAQNRDRAWEIGAFIVSNNFDEEIEIDDDSGTGFRLGYHITARHEIELAFDSVDTEDDVFAVIDVEVEKLQFNYLYNFVYHRRQEVVPYLTGGIGTIRFEVDEPFSGSEDETDDLFNLGAGIRFFFGPRFNLRLDVRTIFFEGDNEVLIDDEFTNSEFSVGLSWVLGG